MNVALDQLSAMLHRTGLLSLSDFESVCQELSATGKVVTADRLLDRLAERGRITEFQRQRVGEGRSEKLVLGNDTIVSCIGAGGDGGGLQGGTSADEAAGGDHSPKPFDLASLRLALTAAADFSPHGVRAHNVTRSVSEGIAGNGRCRPPSLTRRVSKVSALPLTSHIFQ